MAIVRRGGRSYVYRTVRRGGRVTSEYLGAGLLAELAEAEAELHREEKERRREDRRESEALEAALESAFAAVSAAMAWALESSGYHRHHRGEWRKRRMGEEIAAKGDREDASEFEALLRRGQAGDASALPELRRGFDESAGLYTAQMDASHLAREAVARRLSGRDLVMCELLVRRTAEVESELCGADAPALERLLASRVALCWLDAYGQDLVEANSPGGTIAQRDYQGRARDRAHRRFLSASRALAQVRRLRLPPLQVNVGLNQLNVSSGEGPGGPR